MNLTLHLVRKDFLRLRSWLGLWALVLVAKVGIGFLARSGRLGSGEWEWSQVTEAMKALMWLDGALTFLLVLLLVQEDALVGTRQFWITRPIFGGRLFAVKCLGILLMLGGLPVLVALPWWLSCGLGPRELVWAVTETVGLQVAIALPAVLMAVLTDSLQRAILWTFVLVVAVGSGTALLAYFVFTGAGGSGIDLAWSRTWIPLTTLATSAVVVIGLQFYSRHLVRSLAVLGGGIFVAVVVAGSWPAAWSSKFTLAEANADRAAGVTLNFVSATSQDFNPKERDVRLDSEMIARGVPADRWLIGLDSGMQRWRWSGGPDLVRESWTPSYNWYERLLAVREALGLRGPLTDPETERVRLQAWQKRREETRAQRVRNHAEPLPEFPPGPRVKSDLVRIDTEAWVPRSMAAKMRAEPPAFEAQVWMQLLRPDVWFETPIRPGGWQSYLAHQLKITRVKPITARDLEDLPVSQLSVSVIETLPPTWQDARSMFYFPQEHGIRQIALQWEVTVCAVNRALGQMETLFPRDEHSLRVCSVHVVSRSFTSTVSKISRNGEWVDWQPPWIEGARLVMAGFTEEALFKREVKVERFELAK